MQIWWQAHILLGDPTENGPTEGLEQQLHRYLKKVSLFYLRVSPSLLSVFFGFAFPLLYCMIVSRRLKDDRQGEAIKAKSTMVTKAVICAQNSASRLNLVVDKQLQETCV